MEEKVLKLKEILDNSKRIVIFTGAGLSTNSGIPDFRSANGLYNQKSKISYTPEEIISHSFFVRYPKDFYEFYFDKMIYPNALPNIAHKFFAELEETKEVSVVTQNIDNLHQMAGSHNVYELHGSVKRNYCMKCHKYFDLDDILDKKPVPYCECGGIIKPDVVLYEEPLNEKVVYQAIEKISEADTMIIVGTSLMVYPAAGYIRYFKGKNLVLINKSKTACDNMADLVINDDVCKVIEEIKRA